MSGTPWDEDALAAARLRSLARIVRAVGHDARGALGTVTLHGTLLVKALEADAAPPGERTRRWASGMHEGCVRLERLLDAVLGFLAVPRGGDAVLAPVTASLVTLVRPYALAQRVGLIVHDGVAQGPAVPEVVRQVLLDVVLAAIEAAGEGGEVTVATATAGGRGSVTVTGPSPPGDLASQLRPWRAALAEAGTMVEVAAGGGFAVTVDISPRDTQETRC
ncbi:MAG: hypothetical protein KIT14_09780 [bacterium]|nr:hypothetical protein [bacterium]